MSVPHPFTLSHKLGIFFLGTRHHQCMYVSKSLSNLLKEQPFTGIKIFAPDDTSISNSEPLDLREREDESVYVEAFNG